MMKKYFLFLMALIPMVANADAVEVDGIYYDLDARSLTASVTNNPDNYSGSLAIPESFEYDGATYKVTSIGWGAFDNSTELTYLSISNTITYVSSIPRLGLKELHLDDGTERITWSSSTSKSKDLESIYIGRNLEFFHYEPSPFESLESLSSVIIGDSVSIIGQRLFYDCQKLSSINIPNSIKTIGPSAFAGCSLSSLTIPNSLEKIGFNAFAGCPLKNLEIQNGTEMLELLMETDFYGTYNSPFGGCPIKTLYLGRNLETFPPINWFEGDSELNSVAFGTGVSFIPERCFNNCNGLQFITMPSNIDSIGISAFRGCNALSAVYINDLKAWCNIKFQDKEANPLSFAHNLFLNNEIITNLVIPEGTQTINDYAFSGCSCVSAVSFPSSLKGIGLDAFEGCTNISGVKVSDMVSWCNITFSNFYSNPVANGAQFIMGGEPVEDIQIPSSIERLNDFAFCGSSIVSVTIPKSVSSFGKGVFSSCNSLQSVTSFIEEPYNIDIDNFSDFSYRKGKLCVPYDTKDIYSRFDGWRNFLTINEGTDVQSYKLIYMIDENVYKTVRYESGETIVPEPQPRGNYSHFEWVDLPIVMPAYDVTVYASYELGDINILKVADVSGIAGEIVALPIELQNENEVRHCQFDLRLPDGMAVALNSKNKLDMVLTIRSENHTVSSRQLDNGDYRFIISSLENESFIGSQGVIAYISIELPIGIDSGDHIIKLLNAELSVPDGNDLKVVKPADTESKLTISSYTPGDVNNDGSVSVTDVGCTINYILEQVPSVFVFEAADMNHDQSISVTDVGIIINMILNDGAASRAASPVQEEDYGMPVLTNNAGDYLLTLDGQQAFTAFQMDIAVDNDAKGCQVRLSEEAADSHLLTCRKLGDGRYRVVVYSMANEPLPADGAGLLGITADSDISLSNIRFTTMGLSEVSFGNISAAATGIADAFGISQGTEQRIYTLDGRLCRTVSAQPGENPLKGLKAGIYMIGNRKVVVK